MSASYALLIVSITSVSTSSPFNTAAIVALTPLVASRIAFIRSKKFTSDVTPSGISKSFCLNNSRILSKFIGGVSSCTTSAGSASATAVGAGSTTAIGANNSWAIMSSIDMPPAVGPIKLFSI